MRKSIIFESNDNVATSLTNLKMNDRITIDQEGAEEVTIQEQIPFGHKYAIKTIKKGEHVIKYGIIIGRATSDIQVGEHVHIHNVESLQTPRFRSEGEGQ